eukprot:TRINITY_DN2903_c0_g1_i2.p1 TRINITY_DN2903_c0_g1~~TRINITY_DN2903_c0_g1_i2.p1  ORF type:complete len:111 (-),score=37.22 TRINITY_DN2903_c0_g1_i2:164-496(-)
MRVAERLREANAYMRGVVERTERQSSELAPLLDAIAPLDVAINQAAPRPDAITSKALEQLASVRQLYQRTKRSFDETVGNDGKTSSDAATAAGASTAQLDQLATALEQNQ